MPNKDGTGPKGQGPTTGRGMWNCGKKSESENQNLNLGKKNGQWMREWRWQWNGGRKRDEK